MKKVILGLIILMVSLFSFAKGSSHVQSDGDIGTIGSCMVKVDDATTSRFLNVNYIRALEIIRGEDREANATVVVIRMGSNYSNKSSYAIKYGSEKQANDALEDFAYKINNCGNKQ